MPGEDYQSWSVTAANNGNSDTSIEWREGQTRASVNNSSRSEMAAHAKNRNLLNGSIVTGGSANAQTFTSGVGYIAPIPTGLVVKLKIGAGLTNTGIVSLNMDGIGDTLIKTDTGDDLRGGELVGGCYTDFLFNGSNWIFLYSREFFQDQIDGGGGVIIGKQVFVASGTYTPTPGTECCIIEAVGGGGGGAGITSGSNALVVCAGGGGSGGYSRKIATAADIGASQVITIGAAGAGGVAGNNDGGFGGDTSVGVLCVAKGGMGGKSQPSVWQGGLGGSISGAAGDLTAAGSPGQSGGFSDGAIYLGHGGSSVFGGGGAHGQATVSAPGADTGQSASNYGGGGGGGVADRAATSAAGGAGSVGMVIITEFAGRGVPGHDGADGAPGPIGPVGPSGPGTGDVLRFGVPTVGQFAVWTDASHIQGVNPATIAGFTNLVVQTFTASGIYTPSASMKFCMIECVGGGGGGGGVVGLIGGIMNGGGGGSGGYSRKRATAADIGASKAVTIGAAGAGGAVGANNGGVGGTTSVGTLCIANGGQGGKYAQNGIQAGAAGAGGTAGSGDVAAAGAPGHAGLYNTINTTIQLYGGAGGSSAFGGGAPPVPGGGGSDGVPAGPYGSGGGGAMDAGIQNRVGGNGSAGIVIITEYI